MDSDILIVIVVFKKDIASINIIADMSLASEKYDVVIYDNSPETQIDNMCWDFVKYFHAPSNPGVSTAYNDAVRYAISSGKKKILILDQDTRFKLSYIADYLACYNIYKDSYIYAPVICDVLKHKIYSPAALNRFVGKAMPYQDLNGNVVYDLAGKSVINSGLMIPLSIFEKINGFNEKIKLDFSDVYFIEKYKEINPSVILVPIEMEHSLSGDEQPDKNKELHRFKYYCNGAKELARSLHASTTYTCLRRMLRLMIKYYTIQPVITYIKYYLGEAKV